MDVSAALPELSDGEVLLRPWTAADLDCVREASAEGLVPATTSVPERWSAEASAAYLQRQAAREREGEGWSRAVVRVDDGVAVGSVVLLFRPQPGVAGVGYWLAPSARGRGQAARAVALLTEWGLRPGHFHRVEAWVEPGNHASVRTLERCGFRHEGRLRSFLAIGGRRSDVLVLARVRGDGA